MSTDVLQKATRRISPLLLVAAALSFLLPLVGVSCNTAAAQGALGPAVQSLGGGGAQATEATQCLQALSNRDLATYTGTTLAFGGNPSVPGNIPGCPSNSGSPATSTDNGSIGVQPMVLIALILILIGVLATLLRAPLRNLVAGGAALVAAVLVIVNNSSVHTAIIDRLSASGGSSSLSQLGISGGVGAFFDIHAAIGFTLILVALFAALLVNAAGAMAGLRLTSVPPPGSAPAGDFTWPSGAPQAPPPEVPPQLV